MEKIVPPPPPLIYFYNKKEEIISLVKDYIKNNCVEFKKKENEDFLETEIGNYLEILVNLVPQETNEVVNYGQGSFSAGQSGTMCEKEKYSGPNFSNNQ